MCLCCQNCFSLPTNILQGVQAQPLAEGSQLASVASAADQSLSLKNYGNSTSQAAPISQTVLPGPVSNPQITTSSQVPVAGQTIVPTSEQWYQQQQYQQYYQQFVGYDPYQQQYQQYYPYQAQQSQAYVQPLVPSQSQPQPQSQARPQPLVQGQPPGQLQLLLQPQPHVPTTATAPPPNTQVQSTIPPPSQFPSQVPSSHPVTLSIMQPASKSAHYPNQPYMQAPTQLPLNQQSQGQMPQPAVQPVISSSLQRQPNTIPQIPSQTHPAAAIPHLHLPGNQQVIAQTQGQLPLAQSVTGFHSYPQPQPPLGAPQPLPILVQPNTQPHLAQNQVQFPQPSSQVRPFQSQVAIPNQQQSSILPSAAQLPGIPPVHQQPMHPQSQQPGLPVPQRPVMQQYPQHISQQISLPQKQPFGGQSALVQNSQSSVHQQLPTQSQLRTPGPQSFPPQMQHGAYVQHQPNASALVNLRAPNQSPNLVGKPALTSGGPPLIFPHMAGPANSHAMLAGFNPNNIVNSRGEVHPPSEQQPSRNLHSKPEKNANVKSVDLLSKAAIGRDDASSSLGNDGQQGLSEVGEYKQSDASGYENQEPASINDSKDIAKQAAAHDITNSNRSDGRLGKGGDQKDVPALKFEEKSMQEEDKKLIDSFPLSQEDGKPGVRMVGFLKGSGNETNAAYQSGQEENKLAHAQALVNSFGQGISRQHTEGALHSSQPGLAIDHERNRNSQLHIGPSFVSSSIHRNPVGPSHQPHLSTLSMSHHVTPDFENSLPGHAHSFGGMHDSAPSGTVVRPFLPGADGIVGHKYPNSALETEKHFNSRLGYMDGGTPDPRFFGSMESGVFGHPSDIRSNRSRVMGPPGVDPLLESIPGDRSDRSFIEPPDRGYDHTINHEDRRKFRGLHHDVGTVGTFGHFQSGSPLRRSLAGKSFNGHNLDWPGPVAASSRNFYPFGPNAGMVERPFGHPDDHIQRLSSLRMPVRHFEPVPGQSRRDMDGLPAHSPGREYPVLPRNAFGDVTGVPPKNLGPELDRGDPYTSSRFFPESRFPGLHGPFQKEFGEIRNLRMGELARNGDQIPHNLMHSDFQRGQLGSRHFRVGEPVGLGSSHDLVRELTGPESFGKGRLNHPQFLEPRFRSNISPHGFLNDGKYPVEYH